MSPLVRDEPSYTPLGTDISNRDLSSDPDLLLLSPGVERCTVAIGCAESISGVLQVSDGSLYPALHSRAEGWTSPMEADGNNRRAKFYRYRLAGAAESETANAAAVLRHLGWVSSRRLRKSI